MELGTEQGTYVWVVGPWHDTERHSTAGEVRGRAGQERGQVGLRLRRGAFL